MTHDSNSRCNSHCATPGVGTEWTYRPAADVLELDNEFRIVADLPGADRDALDLSVEDGILTIHAPLLDRYEGRSEFARREFGIGNYHRRFQLGDTIDPDGIEAALHDGVLTLVLPKRAESARRRIPVARPSDN